MAQFDEVDNRSKLLLKDDFNKLSKFKIVCLGLGGVGSIVPISLIRSGFKNLTIVDFDRVNEYNLNRQIAYDINDIGRYKTEALKEKLYLLNKDLNINSITSKIDDEFDLNIFNNADFIIDCIDDVKAKIKIIKYCCQNKINLISSLGMGNRLDGTKVTITKLSKTFNDPLARKLRENLKKEKVNIEKINVVFSSEVPIIKDKVISSMIFVPNIAGLMISSFVLNKLLDL